MKRIWMNLCLALASAALMISAGSAQTAVGRGDGDQDGVPDGRDSCPWTPRGASIIAQGCSGLDVSQFPEAFTAPLVRDIGDIVSRMARRDELAIARRAMADIGSLLEDAADQVRQGAVCQVKDNFVRAEERFQAARRAVAEARRTLILSLRGQRRSSEEGDVNATDLSLMHYDIVNQALASAQTDTARSGAVFTRTCESAVGRAIARGIVEKIDDGRRRIVVGGVAAALAEGYRSNVPIGEGYTVDVSGYRFPDGTGVADSVTLVEAEKTSTALKPLKCLNLRLAPAQSIFVTPYTLLEPAAYQAGDGGYSLELGMGIGVKAFGCPYQPGGDYTVQSLEVKVNYMDKYMKFHSGYVMAWDLGASDDPVWFPSNMKPGYQGTIELTWHWRDCPAGSCGAKMVLATESISFTMNERNHFCTATYDTKVLTLDDQDQTSFQPVFVKKLTGAQYMGLSYAEGSQVTFQAETYRILGPGASTYPKAETIEAACSIADGTCGPVPFAVFNDDFYDPSEIYSEAATGVSERAGLMWPRVVGSRNGKTFSYSCSVPRVVRDAVNKDDPYMWTFYRYPFYPGFPTWSMSQGNNGGFTHNGPQKFAFDFVAPAMTPIWAARGGIVQDLREDQTGNKWLLSQYLDDEELNTVCDISKCHENFVLIRHEDGMETWYAHMPQNGVVPQKGQKVFRGDVIAYVGNTGKSTGPHLHFQEQDTSGYSTSSCFESGLPPIANQIVPCFIPKKGDLLFSNNQ